MVRQKRTNGTGSVYQRKDGSWVASVVMGGKRISRYRRNRKDAELVLASLLSASEPVASRSAQRKSVPTLDEWATQWLEFNASRLRPKTISNYRKSIKPVLELGGDMRLTELTPLRLADYLTQLRRAGRGGCSIQRTYTVVRTCLEAAVTFELLQSNPMVRVPKPQWQPEEKRYWTTEEARRFIAAGLSSPRKWAPLCVFLVATGLRVSEACGLTWDDVDLDARRIRVAQTQVYVGGEFHIGPPKSKAGRRYVTLDTTSIEALRRVMARGEGDGVFRTRKDRPPVPGVVKREVKYLCELAGVPVLTPHGLRHVHAMLALKATRDPYLVQRRLGHNHVSVTLGIYGYPTDDEESVAPALDRLLINN
jgi:integrase